MRRGCLLLGLVRYREAFPLIRQRQVPAVRFPWPRAHKLDGMAGQDVFICAEQGLGDGLMFGRFIEPMRQVAARVAIGGHPQAARLLEALRPTGRPFVGPPRGAV